MTRVLAILAAISLAACQPGRPSPPLEPIPATLEAAAGLETISAALARTGLDGTLGEIGPYTLFAPTDRAFDEVPQQVRDTLFTPGNEAELERILRGHVVEGRVVGGRLAAMPDTLTTLAGTELDVRGRTPIVAGGAVVLAIDIPASNGVIHVIDRVLLP